jgi:multiple sugar transport system ATP-binding protein
MAKVVIKDLEKIYPGEGKNPDFKAVHGINLEIKDKEFMVLVGPSGCAKSTTLRMIAGLEDISGGTISIGDRVVNDVLPKDRDIAMVFQNYALYPHMNLFDNMAFGLKLRKFPKDEIRRRVEDAAKILGLDGILERKPKALSGGQRQRVALGRAIVRQPSVFLFDEPLSNLDAKMRVQMRTEISRLHQRLDATMIYVTHDQTEAMTMGDRITVMKLGVIQQVATPLDLYNKPENMFVAGFIGSPPMNFFHGTVAQKDGKVIFTENNSQGNGFSIPLNDALAAKAKTNSTNKIVLGIRPEDIVDTSHGTPEGGYQVVHAEVEVSEPMGSETYLYLTTNEHKFIARVASDIDHEMKSKVSVAFNLNKAHLFDEATELVIK